MNWIFVSYYIFYLLRSCLGKFMVFEGYKWFVCYGVWLLEYKFFILWKNYFLIYINMYIFFLIIVYR